MKKLLLSLIMFVMSSAPADAQCWYQGVALGGTSLRAEDMRTMYFKMEDEGFAVNLCNGYQVRELPIRFEQQFTVSRHYFDSDIFLGFDGLKKTAPISSFSIVQNVFLDIGFERVTPYVGLGVGYHHSKGKFVDYVYGSYPHKYTVRLKKFIYQGTLGFKVPVSHNADISLEYQFRCSKDRKVEEHAFFLGVKRWLTTK